MILAFINVWSGQKRFKTNPTWTGFTCWSSLWLWTPKFQVRSDAGVSRPNSSSGLMCWCWISFREKDATCCLYVEVLLPSREGSRLYSYLLIGQNHYPETTQPTTSPCSNIRKAVQAGDVSYTGEHHDGVTDKTWQCLTVQIHPHAVSHLEHWHTLFHTNCFNF